MKIHRFYVGDIADRHGRLELTEKLWINYPELAAQMLRVLRLHQGEHIVLFDGKGTERMYEIREVEKEALFLVHTTDMVPMSPGRKLHLAWSLLKRDNNELIIQKATELGVRVLLPFVSDRTIKTGFDVSRMRRMAIEAVEQSGRHFLPDIHEPQSMEQLIDEYKQSMPVMVADMNGTPLTDMHTLDKGILVLIGPEGGWSDEERTFFEDSQLSNIRLSDSVLRAETAAITAAALLAG